ncbi:glycosyltransferase [Acidimangrovimonas sediminis]|uniref:glycosyltransferase n=1 Tax=Acidimangrovimonas sediminis TaxID=2056283 RepID=UPI001E4CA2E2|nr:glycosyltransferase [Acidimangrovimonas sediminis]
MRNAPDDAFVLLFNGMIGKENDHLRREFEAEFPEAEVRFWTAAAPAGRRGAEDRRQAAVAIREAAIRDCGADAVVVTSFFEGGDDDGVTAVGATPTAVLLHDLIPHLFPEIYLRDPQVREWYAGKIEDLRRVGCLLAISDCSAQDGITHLGIDAARVVNISSDVDPMFATRPVSESARAALGQEFGLTRPFLMYTGGIDQRKNIPALISAFAALPEAIVADHQLAIVCQAGPGEKETLLRHAREAGLAEGAVVLTGFVSDDTLVTLYNDCKAFVFPSLYEGFGLPALEAMRCGAPVIGAGVSSVPEVIGRADALFDPASVPEMAQMIEKVLTDDGFREDLRGFAPAQAARFDWNESARLALAAVRRMVEEAASPAAAKPRAAGKPRLAFVSPLPPERSGIAYYSAELLPALAAHYEITLVVDQPEVARDAGLSGFPVRDETWLRAHPEAYDRVVFQFGNSHFHGYMFDLLADIPGVSVIHDFYLSGIANQLGSEEFSRVLRDGHGYVALLDRFAGVGEAEGRHRAVTNWPANQRAAAPAMGVIVHSEHARALARETYAPETVADWALVPHLRKLPEVSTALRDEARARLGVAEDEILICSFGYMSFKKLVVELVDAFAQSAAGKNAKVRLVFVGDGGETGAAVLRRAGEAELGARVTINGWTSPEDYRDYLSAADLAVQLRSASRGESSGAVLDCQAYGLATIVNAHGSFADLDPGTVHQIPDGFGAHDLAAAIDRLVGDSELRERLGAAARARIEADHAPEICARAYHDVIEDFYARRGPAMQDLTALLAAMPADEARDDTLAQAIADTFAPGARGRQLLIDVGGAQGNVLPAIRDMIGDLLRHPPRHWRIQPVYADTRLCRYRYARKFSCELLGIPADWCDDAVIDNYRGDVFVGPDISGGSLQQMVPRLSAMAAAGTEIAFLLDEPDDAELRDFVGEGRRDRAVISVCDTVLCATGATAARLEPHLAGMGEGIAASPRILPLELRGGELRASGNSDTLESVFSEGHSGLLHSSGSLLAALGILGKADDRE